MASKALPPEAYALLEAIAKSESAGDWNVIYGGSRFGNYDDHPRKHVVIKSGPNKGRTSTAAGKFQILESTYNAVAPRLGIHDFSPESQLRIAWYLAEDAYGPNLVRDLQSGDPAKIAAVGKKLKGVWTSLPDGIEQTQTSNSFVKNFTRAVETRAGMKVPGMLGDDPQRIRESIQDRNAERLGYGEIAPQPLSRPNSFNETGAPPIPLQRPPKPPSLAEQTGVQPLDPNMSPALQAARQRLTAARLAKTGATTPEAMAATPRITDTDPQAAARRPPLDWGQFKPAVTAGGRGSLLDDGMSPATPNPPKPPVAGLRLPTSPTTVAGRPEAPVGSMPAAAQGKPDPIKAPTSVASGPAAGRPGGATAVPGNGGKVDNGSQANAAATPQTREPQYVTINGKQAQVGQSFVQGDHLMIVDVDASGKGVIRDVTDVRDDFLRKNVDPNAPLLFEKSVAGTAARMIAAPMIKQGIADAGSAAMSGVNKLAGDAVKTVGSMAMQARDGVGSLFTMRPAAQPANTLASLASGPGAGLSAPARPAPAKQNTLVQTTIANPAYAEWVKKYGDGSQVQTAATGGMITANQLAAIQNVNGAVQPPIYSKQPPIPVAPPKTLRVMKPGNNTLAAPAAPAVPKVQTTQTVSGKTVNVGQTYQSGGYLYSFDANGNPTKVGKVGKVGSSNTLAPAVKSATSTSPSSGSGRGITGNQAFADWAFG